MHCNFDENKFLGVILIPLNRNVYLHFPFAGHRVFVSSRGGWVSRFARFCLVARQNGTDQRLDRFHAWENLYCLGRVSSPGAESHANQRTRKRKREIDLIANALWYSCAYNKLKAYNQLFLLSYISPVPDASNIFTLFLRILIKN